MIPRATYRIQLNAAFTFRDATSLLPYLAELGISHVYCSPYFQARPDSTHGYDVVNHNRLNPQIGSAEDLDRFVAGLRAHGMGQILDIVPNHVGIMGADNLAWMDVLQNGQASRYADFFDIDWQPADPALAGKLLVPVLGDTYGAVLERGELTLRHEPATDAYAVWYHEHRFPISPRDYGRATRLLAAGKAVSAEAMHELLEVQAYRLAYWRVASDEINYRRFFDVNDLAALRMENEEVFEVTHRLVFELLRDGKIDGLRVDHSDGLYDPAQYFSRLQDRAGILLDLTGQQKPLYLLIEKITAGFEKLPEDWRVHGTTGYRFANVVNGLFVDASARGRMGGIYRAFTGESLDWAEITRQAKQQILRTSLAAELNILSNQLLRIARADWHTRDFTLNTLRDALAEVIACFPVYRTYIATDASADDRRYIELAVERARRNSPISDVPACDFILATLLAAANRSFAMKFQQVTAPVTAKGVEDTALYRFNRLVSLNEVGGEPETFGTAVRAFHADNRYRARFWPHEMLATSTHDTKRSEDVRARISVLSEMPAEWRSMLVRWRRLNRSHKSAIEGRPAPGPNLELLLYQTLLGTWPLVPMDEAAGRIYRGRIGDYMVKAAREAKIRTSWSDVDAGYETALRQFIRAILTPGDDNEFLADFNLVQRRLARFGLFNSLSQTLCKLMAPGVPDIYQGNELWDFSLVDPDNRRPVDYARRREMLHAMKHAVDTGTDRAKYARSLTDSIEDGRAKLFLTWTALQLRRTEEALFRTGDYLALRTEGARAAHLCAFARRRGESLVIVIVPRLCAKLAGGRDIPPLDAEVWSDTTIRLPARHDTGSLVNAINGRPVEVRQDNGQHTIRVADVLAAFPVALLHRPSPRV